MCIYIYIYIGIRLADVSIPDSAREEQRRASSATFTEAHPSRQTLGKDAATSKTYMHVSTAYMSHMCSKCPGRAS
jgi:hypothetical protein